MVPCFLNLTLQPAVLSPQRSVASLLPYFSFFKLFSFTYLRTLPSSVSCKSFACHSYENGRGAYQQFPFRNSALSSRQPDPRLLRRRHRFLPLCAFCVLCDLSVKSLPFPFFRLSTLDSQLPSPWDLSAFFSHSCRLFCTQQKVNSFVFMEVHTLCTKHRGRGHCYSRVLELPRSSTGHGLRGTTHDSFRVEDSPSGNSVGSAGGASAMASSSG